MTIALALTLSLPQLAVSPQPAEVGVEVVVRAEEGGKPIAGLMLVVEPGSGADGASQPIGATDAAGELRWLPTAPGSFQFVAVHERARWVAPVRVVAAQPRWAYAAALTPLGLFLFWRALRRVRPANGAS